MSTEVKDKKTFNTAQTHLSHVKDNSYAPFSPPLLSIEARITDAPTMMFGAKYALLVTNTLSHGGMRVIPIHGVTDALSIDIGDNVLATAMQDARNRDRNTFEVYAHSLYAPLVSAVEQMQAQIGAVCDAFYGKAATADEEPDEIVEEVHGSAAPEPLNLDTLMIGLANAEERIGRYMEALRTYRTKSDFNKTSSDD